MISLLPRRFQPTYTCSRQEKQLVPAARPIETSRSEEEAPERSRRVFGCGAVWRVVFSGGEVESERVSTHLAASACW